jgi:hypothetical protein
MSGSRLAAFSGGMLIVAEVLLIAAVAIAGKDGWKLITDTGRRFLRRFAPVHKVGRSRYRIGLVMFTLPLVLGWATPYLTALWTLEGHHLALAAVIGDLVFLTSLFILGGEFWQKLQSLFTYGTASDTTTAPSIGDQP